jgi:8-oxo-dGTP pyrophosphatase MutT (NUDIX family)
VEVLLVTGRSSRRWLVPKGWPMRDRSLAEAAAQEAFEEAGVRGRVAEAIGSFGHAQNHRLLGRFQVSILVHPLAVETQLADWPERRERSRRWFGLDQAREAVASPELRRILARFAESLPEPLAR